jgi:hypothetical protein
MSVEGPFAQTLKPRRWGHEPWCAPSGRRIVATNQEHAAPPHDVLAAAIVRPFVLQTAARELHPLHAAAVEKFERMLPDAPKDGPVTNVA